jgi:hypothetical protein
MYIFTHNIILVMYLTRDISCPAPLLICIVLNTYLLLYLCCDIPVLGSGYLQKLNYNYIGGHPIQINVYLRKSHSLVPDCLHVKILDISNSGFILYLKFSLLWDSCCR